MVGRGSKEGKREIVNDRATSGHRIVARIGEDKMIKCRSAR
jgi:hypothetical protein